MKLKLWLCMFVAAAVLGSCGGPEKDARAVCSCYKEVVHIEDSKAEEKLNECLELLDEYTKKHKENGTYDEFEYELNVCR